MAWFRVGSDRYAKTSRTHGVTTLTKRHVSVRGTRVSFRFRAKHRLQVRTTIVDSELAEAIKELLAQPGGARLFRYGWNGESCMLTGAVLNDYIREHMGEEFTAKDFRTWGGTLTAAIALAEHGVAETDAEAKRVVDKGDAHGRRAAREYSGRRPRLVRQPGSHRAVSRRENDRGFPAAAFAGRQSTRHRSRSGRECAGQFAAFVANQACAQGRVIYASLCDTVSAQNQVLQGGIPVARKTVLVSDISGAEIAEGKGATIRITFHDARKGVRELDVTDAEAEKMGGRQVARRGRRPKSATQ